MKKRVVLSFATFYLLLTTGLFVCLVHCATAELVGQPKMQMAQCGVSNTKHQKHCCCCDSHANFIVKENIKPALYNQVPLIPVLIRRETISFYPQFLSLIPKELFHTKEPPGKSGRLIAIQIRSLQI